MKNLKENIQLICKLYSHSHPLPQPLLATAHIQFETHVQRKYDFQQFPRHLKQKDKF